MHPSAFIQTIHYAHILIYPAEGLSDTDETLRRALDNKVSAVIAKHAAKYPRASSHQIDPVELEPEFCCIMLTEVGLHGTSLEAVTAAATEIAEWASKQKKLRLAVWKDGERQLL